MGRRRGEIVADRLEGGHVPGREHRARILRVAAARRVVERREQLALPEEHAPGGVADRVPDGRRRGHAPRVHLMGGRGDDVVRLGHVQGPVVCGIGPGHDRLSAQRFARPSVTGFGLEHPGQILVQTQLVDDRESLAGPDDLQRGGVLASVQPDRRIAREAEARRRPSIDLDALPGRDRLHAVRAPGPPRARGTAAELPHFNVDASKLCDPRVLHQRHADRVGRDRRGLEKRHHRRRREQAHHRRPSR